jgi:hypothetical protein
MNKVVDIVMFDFGGLKYVASVAEDGTMRIRKRAKNGGWEKVRPSEVIPSAIAKVDAILTRRLNNDDRMSA